MDNEGTGGFVKTILSLLSLSFISVACAGVDADLERASYLLGKGGVANATAAASILAPYIENQTLSGEKALEAARLYAGAKMGEAGFDSITIVASIVFPGDESLLKILSDSIVEDLEDGAADFLTQALDALDAAIASTSYTSLPDSKDRIRRGLQFQRSLVDLLSSVRVLVNLSGFRLDNFTAENCESTLALGDELNGGVQAVIDARNRLRSVEGVGLSENNSLVSSLTSIIQEINPTESGEIADPAALTTLCEYLKAQKDS